MTSWFFVFAALAPSAETAAVPNARYHLVSEDQAQIQYIDEASIRKEGAVRIFTLLGVWAEPKQSADGRKDALYVKVETRIDCAARRVQPFSYTLYTKSGPDKPLAPPSPALAITPASAAEADYVCDGEIGPDGVSALSEEKAIAAAMSELAQNRTTADARYRLMTTANVVFGLLDEASVFREGAVRDYTMLLVWAKPRLAADGRTELPYVKYRVRIDCAAGTRETYSATPYTMSGPGAPTSLPARSEPVDTHRDPTANYLCNGVLDPKIAGMPLSAEKPGVRVALQVMAENKARQARGK